MRSHLALPCDRKMIQQERERRGTGTIMTQAHARMTQERRDACACSGTQGESLCVCKRGMRKGGGETCAGIGDIRRPQEKD